MLLPDAVHYIQALVPFFPLLCAMFFGDYIIKAMGHPLYATSVMGMTVVLNIVLDLVFVAVLGWGVMGARTGYRYCFYDGSLFQRAPFVFTS